MLKEIPKSDIIVRPIKVYKEWTLDENDVKPIFGETITGLVDVENGETSHGYNKNVIYTSIKSQFYRNSSTASILTEVGKRHSYASNNERVLGNELVVISIPQRYVGEGIKIGSVRLEDEQTQKVYTDDSFSNLLDSGSNVAGNIFYDRGTIVLTRDILSGSVMTNFTLEYRSTQTIYENEIFVSVLENEFNVSQNPSAVYEIGNSTKIINVSNASAGLRGTGSVDISYYEPGTRLIRNSRFPYISNLDTTKMGSFDDYLYSGSIDPTGSFLAPYITTIALYDDNLDMVAVAKLAQPIKSLPDYPLNFIVRFDT
jgi:hypothetical protein